MMMINMMPISTWIIMIIIITIVTWITHAYRRVTHTIYYWKWFSTLLLSITDNLKSYDVTVFIVFGRPTLIRLEQRSKAYKFFGSEVYSRSMTLYFLTLR